MPKCKHFVAALASDTFQRLRSHDPRMGTGSPSRPQKENFIFAFEFLRAGGYDKNSPFVVCCAFGVDWL
jgi:hypothetical protein